MSCCNIINSVTLGYLGKSTAVWTGIRYFAIDYDNGLDTNIGYSDTSLADAGTKAVKTLEHFKTIFPKEGNGQTAVVAIRNRAAGATYRNIAADADDDLNFLQGVSGYQNLVVRGTGTVATASAVAFANDTADKICCGSQIVSGTNAGGYNPTGTPTTSVIDCQLAGGGAANLSAEPALIMKRIRFDSATATVALRNACSAVWLNTASQITLSANLSVAPSTSDVFYIEEPGVAVNHIASSNGNHSMTAYPPSFAQSGVQIVGFRAVSTDAQIIQCRGAGGLMNISFCETTYAFAPNTGYSAVSTTGHEDMRFTNSYSDEAAVPNTIVTGVGVRSSGGITFTTHTTATIAHSAAIVARFQCQFSLVVSVGAGCYSNQGAILTSCGTGGCGVTNIGGVTCGNGGSTSSRRFRVVGSFTAGVNVSASSTRIYGCDFSNCGTDPLIAVNGISLGINIADCVGSTGNTGSGLDLSNARDCGIIMGTMAANTFTAAAGQDIKGAGPVYYVHADYARTDLKDQNGNHIQGSGTCHTDSVVLLTNDANADIGQYRVVRLTGSGVVRVAKADTAANATGVVGVSQSLFTAAGPQAAMHVASGGSWVQFDAAPTAGNLAYLSTANAGQAQDSAPTVAGTNQKLRLGRIAKVSGTLGLVALHPELLPVTADGNP